MILLLNSMAHFLVDGLCAATVYGQIGQNRALLLLLYNTLAFSTQCLVGLWADTMRRVRYLEAVSALLLVSGYILPVSGLIKIILIGAGNSGFHVAGGVMTLRESKGKAAKLGVFVSPGAIGLMLGALYPNLGAVFAALLVAAVGIVVVKEKETDAPSESVAMQTGKTAAQAPELLPVLLLTSAVAVRAIGGSAVHFPWKHGAAGALLMTAFVAGGKTAGGYLCDSIGYQKAALFSLIPASILIAFCSSWAVPSLLGQFALNLTMPVTLWLLYRIMPDSPGLSL